MMFFSYVKFFQAFQLQMLPVVIVGASSLHNALLSSESTFKAYENVVTAEPGMSLNNLNPNKNVYKVIRRRYWRTEQYIIWHDVISNSISQHPTQPTSPMPFSQLLAEIKRLASLNVVANCFLPRSDSLYNLSQFLPQVSVEMSFVKLRPLLSRHYRDILMRNDMHLSHKLEKHLLARFFNSQNLFALMHYKRRNRDQCKNRKRFLSSR